MDLFRRRPTLPPGRRIYAVGDVHGRFDLLGELITRIGSTPVTNADEAKAAFAKANLDNGLRMDLISKEGQRLVMVPKKADR